MLLMAKGAVNAEDETDEVNAFLTALDASLPDPESHAQRVADKKREERERAQQQKEARKQNRLYMYVCLCVCGYARVACGRRRSISICAYVQM